MTQPSCTEDGLRSRPLRFGEHLAVDLVGALLSFCHLFAGFTNRHLVELVSALLQRDADSDRFQANSLLDESLASPVSWV